ncbi:hypothetical protein GCM10022395_15470 [Snuella lapsa]|uniref:Uncharacterized protein n=1 Tax=Snuella lapsa TaxID=870481 RepID=A0ABP6XIW6_9FLAO
MSINILIKQPYIKENKVKYNNKYEWVKQISKIKNPIHKIENQKRKK